MVFHKQKSLRYRKFSAHISHKYFHKCFKSLLFRAGLKYRSKLVMLLRIFRNIGPGTILPDGYSCQEQESYSLSLYDV